MEYYHGGMQATIYLDKDEGDLEALYNILSYYRLSGEYDRMLNGGSHNARFCEDLFVSVRDSLRRENDS